MEIGKYLTKARKLNGLSQEDVANSLNVSRQSVSLWECDQTQPSLDNLVSLSKLYNISIDELTGQKEFYGETQLNQNASNVVLEKDLAKTSKKFLILAISFEIAAAIFYLVPFFGIIITFPGIVFSILSYQKRKNNISLLFLILGISLLFAALFCTINMEKIGYLLGV